jgi:hypothetical protein
MISLAFDIHAPGKKRRISSEAKQQLTLGHGRRSAHEGKRVRPESRSRVPLSPARRGEDTAPYRDGRREILKGFHPKAQRCAAGALRWVCPVTVTTLKGLYQSHT